MTDTPQQPVKRGPGRPPKHRPANQYTGVRAKQIDRVRQVIWTFLDREMALNPDPTQRFDDSRDAAAYYKCIVTCFRLLLACEHVQLWSLTPTLSSQRTQKLQESLTDIGAKMKTDLNNMPDLAAALKEAEKRLRDASL